MIFALIGDAVRESAQAGLPAPPPSCLRPASAPPPPWLVRADLGQSGLPLAGSGGEIRLDGRGQRWCCCIAAAA
ncbi:hypothetical protein JOD64_003978 [Micromonospora luteifusca]|uniref:Uncharacterized protein n=1 Tax=Micromonospora luteifusca TaxID=709860 RepID=A0ABS2LX47_9ACTN|nr:hypothetical protein [Micromonospora luteifusca]